MEVVYTLREVGGGRWSLVIWLLDGASWGPGGKNAWTEKVGEDAHHLQVIWDVELKVVRLKKGAWGKRCDGKEEKHQKGSRENIDTNKLGEGERRAQTRHVLP